MIGQRGDIETLNTQQQTFYISIKVKRRVHLHPLTFTTLHLSNYQLHSLQLNITSHLGVRNNCIHE